MQKYHVEMMRKGEWQGDQAVYCADEVAAHVDELNAEIERLKSESFEELYNAAIDERDAALEKLAACFEPGQLAQPPVVLPTPPSHEQSYQNNLTEALRERDTLRDVLTLLAPDLKTMAILYQKQGDFTRAQALNNICKSVGV